MKRRFISGIFLFVALSFGSKTWSQSDYGQLTYPYRSLDGGKTFADVSRRFDSGPGAPTLHDWRIVAGYVGDAGKLTPEWQPLRAELGANDLLIYVDKKESSVGVAGGAAATVVHLVNYPKAHEVVDGKYIVCLAKAVGRFQYGTVGGGRATVLSYDHGTLPTPEQFASFQEMKRTNYLNKVAEAMAARSNKLARSKLLSTNAANATNYSITPTRK